jgi:hypothetical protein
MALRLVTEAPRPRPAATFLKLTWIIAGHLMALVAAARIVLATAGRLTRADALLWLACGSVVLARWIEVTQYRDGALDRRRGSREALVGFALIIVLEGLILWGAAHALGLVLAV